MIILVLLYTNTHMPLSFVAILLLITFKKEQKINCFGKGQRDIVFSPFSLLFITFSVLIPKHLFLSIRIKKIYNKNAMNNVFATSFSAAISLFLFFLVFIIQITLQFFTFFKLHATCSLSLLGR